MKWEPEVAFTPPDSDEGRVESKVGRLYPIDVTGAAGAVLAVAMSLNVFT
ncbi:hypothetical protein ACFYW9_28045 [Streptomyces sp. NPDC002698]